MSNKNLGILAVVAAIMVLWAVVQSRLAHRSTGESSGPSYLIQGLETAQIASIVVGHGDDAVTIQRRDQQFAVIEKAGYPADPKRINDLINKLQSELAVTSIVVTHDMQSAYKVADNMAMLNEGRIIFHGPVAAVRETDHPAVRQFIEGRAEGPLGVF